MFGALVAPIASVTALRTADAHETWFVRTGHHAGEHFSMDVTNGFVLAGAAVLALSALVLHRATPCRALEAMLARGERWLPTLTRWRIVAVLAGIMLMANSLSGQFLAPDFVLPGDRLVALGAAVQLVIGLLLVSLLSLPVAGVLISAVAIPMAAVYAPRGFLVDYLVEYLALAAAFLFAGLDSSRGDRRAPRWMKRKSAALAALAVPVIRVGLGLTLILLSIHHKLIDPDLALTFLDTYDFNFMRHLGFTAFTNLHFVFAAGVMEITFGCLLLAGVATRFVAGGLAVFLLTTLILLGPVELVGHLPLIAVTLLLAADPPEHDRVSPTARYQLEPLAAHAAAEHRQPA
jgi:uncharacterized membrane protein YphA (DoxX/SURF4 family)